MLAQNLPSLRTGLRLPLLIVLCVVGGAVSARPGAAAQMHWLPPRLETEGGLTVLPKAYYSSDNDVSLGFELLRPFRFPGSSRFERDAEIEMGGRVTQNGHIRATTVGTVFFHQGRYRLRTRLRYDSLYRRFWGVGGNSPSSNQELFRPQNTLAYVELFRRVASSLHLGIRLEYQHFKYAEVEEGGLLDVVDYPGEGLDNIFGGGIVAEYDTRDDLYSPRRGSFVQGFAIFFEEGIGSEIPFSNFHVDARRYFPLPAENVLALQVFSWSAGGDAPIWRYAELGGRVHSRGYRRARYIDQSMLASQVEWRMPLGWRLSGAVFAGAAAVAPRFDALRLDELHPTGGGGLRWRVRPDKDVVVRGDLAFGKDSVRAFLSFGQAF